MKKQIAVRTAPHNEFYQLSNLLKEGYHVVMCNPVGAALEYILEKEEAGANENPCQYCQWNKLHSCVGFSCDDAILALDKIKESLEGVDGK